MIKRRAFLGGAFCAAAAANRKAQSASASRFTAGAAGFLNFSQSRVRPEV